MPRLTRIYTRRGDDGTTGLGGGQRVDKDSLRVHAYGTVDELNSAIGVALAHGVSERLGEPLRAIQNDLFHLGSDLCFIEADKARLELPQLSQARVDALEHLIDACNDATGPLENFILPGGSVGAAQLHVARTICRRAERDVTTLSRSEGIGSVVLPYLNRLSDALFAMARLENQLRGVAEPLWNSRA